MSDRLVQGETIWKLPRAFGWVLPLGAAWMFVLVYTILHVFLGIPTAHILSPYIAFSALTLAMGIGVFWGARYSERIRSIRPVLCVVAVYGLVCFPLWAHYALSLGIGRPESVVAGTWISEGVWCAGSIWAIWKSGPLKPTSGD
jgi:hypothetical protein